MYTVHRVEISLEKISRLTATLKNLLVKAKPQNFNVLEGDKVPQ
jgi:hypothetical protein